MRYRIYIGHSRDERLNYQEELYSPLISSLDDDVVIVPHENGAEAQIDSEEVLPTCNLMIAEVSYPSTGLGWELKCAQQAAVPVLCIYKISCRPSSSVTNKCPNIISYESTVDMIEKVAGWILDHEDKLKHTGSSLSFQR